MGVLLTQWSIRVALVPYAAYLAQWIVRPESRGGRAARIVWTAGCLLFLLHVAFAFRFYHQWSHTAAWESTAKETDEMLGFRFGDGIYFSYLFAALWTLDVVCRWLTAARPQTFARLPKAARSGLEYAVHAYLFFIAFNGAIIFEAGPTRWAGIAVCIGLLILTGLVLARRSG